MRYSPTPMSMLNAILDDIPLKENFYNHRCYFMFTIQLYI